MTEDSRSSALQAWVACQLDRPLAWSRLATDAGRRRYFRAHAREDSATSWIAVDAPPAQENIAAFVQVAGLMAGCGLNVPHIHAIDAARGFMLLSDLGDRRYLETLDAHNADALMGSAIGALLDWQAASKPGVLPDYDRATFAREMALFHEWFIPHVGCDVPAGAARAALDRAYTFILDRVTAQPPVFVHRDYMPRNLMISHPLPGIIDFQDARYGPATYDVASLFRDAFISWPEPRIDGWVRHYWDGAIGRGLPVAADWSRFRDDLALTGAQRHLKILGLFVRLAEADGKPAYARDLPRFVAYLLPVAAAYEELAPLIPYLERARTVLGELP